MNMIPLSIPEFSGNEWAYAKQCLDTGWVSSAGSYVNRFEETLAEFVSSKYSVATVNGTAALHVALRVMGVKENDYVIVPNITFIASINSIRYLNANPILIDVDPFTWQMDLTLLEEFLETKTEMRENNLFLIDTNKRIKAIMPVHVLGNMCDIIKLVKLCEQYNLDVIEDASESLGTSFNGKHSGTFGKMGVFSFNGNKIITTGGGGMIVTDVKELASRAKHLTTQAKKEPDEYVHDEIGYNYRLVNILAAIGVAQMEQLPIFIQRKKFISEFYQESLKNYSNIRFQLTLPEVNWNSWLITTSVDKKQELINYLNSKNIMARSFWIPMNQLPMFKDDLYVTKMDQSEKIYNTCLSIPSSACLTDKQMETIVKSIKEFHN